MARLAAGLQSAHNNLQAILDSVDNATYVVDCDTHRLLYLNRKTQELVPTAKVDDLCHEAFLTVASHPASTARCPSCLPAAVMPAARSTTPRWASGRTFRLRCCRGADTSMWP